MTPINTDELVQQMRAAAEAATPGPWRRLTSFRVISSGDKPVAGADCRGRSISSARNDADHIALANPANVLALIAALEAANARADAAEAKVARLEAALQGAYGSLRMAAADDPIYEPLAASVRDALASEALS